MHKTLKQITKQGFGFAVFPEVWIYDEPEGKAIQHLLFGDYITPPKTSTGKAYMKWGNSLMAETTKGEKTTTWLRVRSRQEEGWIKLDDIQAERLLEVNFVDIGQGDGCHMVTPSDEHFIIDAGESDNMYRYLRWRFNLSKKGKTLPKFHALASHPDQDHWKGFQWLLSKPPADQPKQIEFEIFYHNGIIQRNSTEKLGKETVYNDEKYLAEFVDSKAKLKTILQKKTSKSNYEKFLIAALANFPSLKVEAVYRKSTGKNLLYKDHALELEILGPVTETISGKKMLKWFDEHDGVGKTKNGHSVILMAKIGKIKIMLGGDLNSKSADYLMEKYTGADLRKLRTDLESADLLNKVKIAKKINNAIQDARVYFEAEIAKSCHHGSHDITDEFLQSINAIATIISSGDEESHCHPRPETLGAIGKYGRGSRPLIFSTELARSSPEFIELNAKNFKNDKIKQRIVATYGMITVRTDGERTIIAQKLEKNRSQFGKLIKWHIDKIIWNDEREEFITKV